MLGWWWGRPRRSPRPRGPPLGLRRCARARGTLQSGARASGTPAGPGSRPAGRSASSHATGPRSTRVCPVPPPAAPRRGGAPRPSACDRRSIASGAVPLGASPCARAARPERESRAGVRRGHRAARLGGGCWRSARAGLPGRLTGGEERAAGAIGRGRTAGWRGLRLRGGDLELADPFVLEALGARGALVGVEREHLPHQIPRLLADPRPLCPLRRPVALRAPRARCGRCAHREGAVTGKAYSAFLMCANLRSTVGWLKGAMPESVTYRITCSLAPAPSAGARRDAGCVWGGQKLSGGAEGSRRTPADQTSHSFP